MSLPLSPSGGDSSGRQERGDRHPGVPAYLPGKMGSEAIFALLDRAPFSRLATYAPPTGEQPGRSYVIPLQFVHREGSLLIITRPGRKVDNLRAHPAGVCLQVDVSEGDGWTSICAWGSYTELRTPGERLGAVFASFGKYPDRTTRQASAWLRRRTPGYTLVRPEQVRRDFVVGRIDLASVSGRYWPDLHVPRDSPLLRGEGPGAIERLAPRHLGGAACRSLLDSTPLARLACFQPSRGRSYCLPIWFLVAGHDIWIYHPAPAGELPRALRDHPAGVCLQADNLDNSPYADPGHRWSSVLAEGSADVYELGPQSSMPLDRQHAILAAICRRLSSFGIRTAFAPPAVPESAPSGGLLLRLRIARLSGQATG